MRNDNVIGIDLAKNVFQIHIADGEGKKLGSKKLKRNQLLTYFANLSPSFIGIGQEVVGWAKLASPRIVHPTTHIKNQTSL